MDGNFLVHFQARFSINKMFVHNVSIFRIMQQTYKMEIEFPA